MARGGSGCDAYAGVMPIEVADNQAESRYEVRVDGKVAGFTMYRPENGGRVAFFHTEVDPAYEGKGLGSRLARGALDATRKQGKSVVARCPFIAGYVRRHPDEYADLVIPEP